MPGDKSKEVIRKTWQEW